MNHPLSCVGVASFSRIGGLVTCIGVLSACSPALHPLYRDYKVAPHTDVVEARIERALASSGWHSVPGPAPNVIATNERRVRSWGVYSVVVSLEAVPVGDGYVRLLVHPYRHYIWGTRSKVPFLNSTIRRSVLRDFDAAMAAQELIAAGTGVSRDRGKTQ